MTNWARARAPALVCAWPMRSTPEAISPGPPTACDRQRAHTGIATRPPRLRPTEHEQFVDSSCASSIADFFARLAGAGSPSRAAGFRLRLAAFGHDADRTGARQPFTGPRRRRIALARRSFEAMPGLLGRCRSAARMLPDLDPPTASRGWPSNISNAWQSSTAAAVRADRRQDARQLHVSRPAGGHVPEAVFIHCRRDLRDVAVSCWMTDFRSIRWANDPSTSPRASSSIAG